jgi:hypothetical protein
VGFGDSVADGPSVLATLGEAVWSGLVVGSVECAIDGMVVHALNDGTVICALNDGTVICALDDALFLFFFLLHEVDFLGMLGTVDVSAVAGDMM